MERMAYLDFVSDGLGLGLEAKDLSWLQVSLRAIIVFLMTLLTVRLASRRFLAKLSAFDAVLGFMLASMLARAINGSAPFVPTLVAGLVLVGLHRLLAGLSFRSKRFGKIVKGSATVLARSGKIDTRALQSHEISEADFFEELRLNANVDKPDHVETATLERNGQISVVIKGK